MRGVLMGTMAGSEVQHMPGLEHITILVIIHNIRIINDLKNLMQNGTLSPHHMSVDQLEKQRLVRLSIHTTTPTSRAPRVLRHLHFLNESVKLT